MSTASRQRRLTIAEYLALENDSPTKHEFRDGAIVNIPPPNIRHNVISGNILAGLHARLRGKGSRPFGSDLRIYVRKSSLFTYADVQVIGGKVETSEDCSKSVTNPRVIFEVLSRATENYDRGPKWELYQQHDSLQEYVHVSQEEAKITHYSRLSAGLWRYVLIGDIDQTLHLPSLDCELPLTEIYDNVTFGPETDDTPEPPRQR